MQYFIVFKAYTILVYTLYATNNAIFYCFKAFKALCYFVSDTFLAARNGS